MKIELNKDKKTGILITILFHLSLLIVFMLLSLKPPTPPPPQIGVEVNLGNSDDGSGKIQPELSANTPTASTPKQSSTNEKVMTQNTESSIKMSQNDKITKTQKEVETPEEPKIDNRYMFDKNKIKTQGGSEGDGKTNGDKGVKGGNPDADNYKGTPGVGNTPSFDLIGRGEKKLPPPYYDVNEQGTVVVKIWVDRNGRVTAAQAGVKGSTTTSSRLQSLAYQAAMKSEFKSKPDAPDVQIGTITYVFQLR